MTLIDPAAIAEIKGRRAAGTLGGTANALTQRQRTITPLQLVKAFTSGTSHMETLLREARQRTDGTEIAAQIVFSSINLHCFASEQFAEHGLSAKGRVREKTDEVLTTIWDTITKAIAGGLEEVTTDIRGELDAANARIAELEAELQRRAEEPMPKPEKPVSVRPVMPPHLAALSFVAFLRSQGHKAQADGKEVFHSLSLAEHDQLNAEWRRAIPDAAAALAQLRAIVGLILRGEAQSAA